MQLIPPASLEKLHEVLRDNADNLGRRIVGIRRERVAACDNLGPQLRRSDGTAWRGAFRTPG